MSKGNLFLGTASGKVGDVVFSRQGGEQIARVRNRSPKNPQTPLQMAQRVIMSTVGKAYSLMAPIADHAFQGRAEGTECQSRFTELNIALLRRAAADALNEGSAEAIITSQATNFNGKGDSLVAVNPFIISEGSLPSPRLRAGGGGVGIRLGITTTLATVTYGDIINAMGAQRGDQLTIVLLTTDQSEAGVDAGFFNGFHFCRIILDPSEGDLTTPFLKTPGQEDPYFYVNKPNAKNEGNVIFDLGSGTSESLLVPIVDRISAGVTQYSEGAVGAILSRKTGELWQRSTSALVLYTAGYDTQIHYLGDAVLSYMSDAGSSLYLNQAENF